MRLEDVQDFVAVVGEGSLAGAARRAGRAASSLSRAMARLEGELGVRLLHRTTRKLALTEAGERFLERAHDVLDVVERARDDARAASGRTGGRLEGRLRVGASVAFGTVVLAPLLAELRAAHPALKVELALSDRRADVVGERLDLVLRHGRLPDSGLVARKVRDVRYRLVGTGDPLPGPEALKDRARIALPLPGFAQTWRLVRGARAHALPVNAAMVISSPLAVRAAVRAGAGVSVLADWMVDAPIARGELTDMLPEWRVEVPGTEPAIWALRPSREPLPRKVEAFLEALAARIDRGGARD